MEGLHSEARAVLFDLDGTVYYGSDIVPGTREAIAFCKELGKQVAFLSNNSALTRRQVFEKLEGMGVPCELDEVITAGYTAARFIRREGFGRVFVCGMDGLREELEGCGVEMGGFDDAECLLIGYDPDFNYRKCTMAVRAALRADVIIACNKERSFSGEGAELFPGCGAMVASVEWCSNRDADYVVGKPNTLALELFCRKHGYVPDGLLVVGDTLESDIAMADRFGCRSLLVGHSESPGVSCIGSIGDLVPVLG